MSDRILAATLFNSCPFYNLAYCAEEFFFVGRFLDPIPVILFLQLGLHRVPPIRDRHGARSWRPLERQHAGLF